MSTVLKIKAAIDAFPLAERIKLVQLLNSDSRVPHPPGGLDLEVDNPELEAELLKAANQPHDPFEPENLRAACEEIICHRLGAMVALRRRVISGCVAVLLWFAVPTIILAQCSPEPLPVVGGINRCYDDGFVFVDVSGNAGGRSTFWEYQNASQIYFSSYGRELSLHGRMNLTTNNIQLITDQFALGKQASRWN